MAVVHWTKVTKDQYTEYKAKLIEKYGSGTEAIKSVERIPNRIIITAPVSAVMDKILADTELDPRPEPYVMPGKNASPQKSSAPKPVISATGNLPPPSKLAPVSPAGNPFAAPKALPPITSS